MCNSCNICNLPSFGFSRCLSNDGENTAAKALKSRNLVPIYKGTHCWRPAMLNPTFTIDSPDSGIEMPPLRRYPFNRMGVGDSILIDDFRLAQSARVSAINYIKRHDLGWKFSIRKMENGWRIFRVN